MHYLNTTKKKRRFLPTLKDGVSTPKKKMKLLTQEKPLLPKHRNHKLKGEYIGYWECHIEPDWLLVYKKTETHIIFARTGSHSDLF
jgi:mRNA interferase YafQ